MVLNLLLSHTPAQVEELLKRSFATWLLITKAEDSRQKSRMANMFTKSCGKIFSGTWIFSRRPDL
jgi:hypothetical protein